MNNIKGKAELDLQYVGRVSIKLAAGNKVLSTLATHNTGGTALFNYLVLCLAGEYAVAERQRPLKIKLFQHSGNPTGNIELTTDQNDEASNFIAMTSAPTIKEKSIILHYIIPFSQITKDKIDQICLYGVGETSNQNYSAGFLIKDDNGALAPITITKAMSNLSLILDWELSIGNVSDFNQA